MQLSSSPGFPQWSPDGKTIAFHGDPLGRPDVIIVPAAGGEPRVLTQIFPNGGYPRLSRDLFYVKTANGTSALWRLPLAGGSPVKVLDAVVLSNFDVVDTGVYFIDLVGAGGSPAGATPRLQFFDFAMGRTTTVAHDLGTVGFGLSASPDGRTVYYSRIDSSVEELMVVDDFR